MTAAINLWIDDRRPAPEGWTRVMSVKDAITAFKDNTVADVAMDFCLLDGGADEIMWWLIDNPTHRPTGEIVPQSSDQLANQVIAELAKDLRARS